MAQTPHSSAGAAGLVSGWGIESPCAVPCGHKNVLK